MMFSMSLYLTLNLILFSRHVYLKYVVKELKKELDEGYKQMQLMGEFAEELQATEVVQETNHLEKLLHDYKNSAKAERERLRKLEADSAERDKQLAEALTRIGQYENGTYGLREAVQVSLLLLVLNDMKQFFIIRNTCELSTLGCTVFRVNLSEIRIVN